MKLRRIKEILHVCEKTIDNYVNRIGASDEIVEYIENLQSQLKAKEEENQQLKEIINKANELTKFYKEELDDWKPMCIVDEYDKILKGDNDDK